MHTNDLNRTPLLDGFLFLTIQPQWFSFSYESPFFMQSRSALCAYTTTPEHKFFHATNTCRCRVALHNSHPQFRWHTDHPKRVLPTSYSGEAARSAIPLTRVPTQGGKKRVRITHLASSRRWGQSNTKQMSSRQHVVKLLHVWDTHGSLRNKTCVTRAR